MLNGHQRPNAFSERVQLLSNRVPSILWGPTNFLRLVQSHAVSARARACLASCVKGRGVVMNAKITSSRLDDEQSIFAFFDSQYKFAWCNKKKCGNGAMVSFRKTPNHKNHDDDDCTTGVFRAKGRSLHEQSPGGPNENGRKANAPKSKKHQQATRSTRYAGATDTPLWWSA